jgi:hypothetical protein
MSEQRNPFQSPDTPQSEVRKAAPIKPFESGHMRALWANMFLAVVAVANAVGASWTYLFFQSAMGGGRTPIASGSALVNWANNAATVGAIIAFSMWTHRVYRNLSALGARDLRCTPGWAVGWLFIPLANLVVPYFVFAEIWRNSIPAPPDSARRGNNRISPLLIGWWIVNILPFVVLVVGLVGLVVVARVSIGVHAVAEPGQIARSIDDRMAAWFVLAGVAVPLLGSSAAILAIFVVRRIDKNQQTKYEIVRGTAGTALNPDRGSVS